MIRDELSKRRLPDLLTFQNGERVTDADAWRKRREEIKKILCEHEYGFLPPAPEALEAEIIEKNEKFCAGSVTLTKVLLKAKLPEGEFAFPIACAIPNGKTSPAFVHINFRDNVPDAYMPTEEICDNGYAVLSFCYKDVTTDDGDFTNGLAGLLTKGDRAPDSPGKIAMWAWAAMRVMDYAQTLPSIDKNNIAVVGHSRLGKTALLAGAMDERFACVISNDSGCSGAAISRGKVGETIGRISTRFPFWFCENYAGYGGREYDQPFDQHYLLSLAAPRKLYVASAENDEWADPASEFLGCAAVSEVYELLGEKGFVHADAMPKAGDAFHDGTVGYHLRAGEHYLSRSDWNQFFKFMG